MVGLVETFEVDEEVVFVGRQALLLGQFDDALLESAVGIDRVLRG